MADIELNDAPQQELSAGGYIVTLTDAASPEFRRLRVSDVQAGIAKAETALQPGGLGTAAYADTDQFATKAEVADIGTALAAILAGGD